MARAEHNTKAQMDHADSCVDGGLSRRFPLTAEASQKSIPGCGFFSQQLLASTPIYSYGRSDDERLWRPVQAGESECEGMGGINPAGREFVAIGGSPAMRSHTGAGKVDGGGAAFEGSRMSNGRAVGRVPLELAIC